MSAQFLIGFYAVCAVAVALLLWRHFRRTRQRSRFTETHRSGAAEQRRDVEPQPGEPVAQAERSPVEQLQPVAKSMASPEGRVTWVSRRLFEAAGVDRSEEDNDLPPIAPADIPAVRNDDYVFGGLTPLFASLLPESARRRADLHKDLQGAGYYQPHAAENLAAVRYVGIMLSLLLFGSLLVIAPRRMELPIMAIMVVSSTMAWALPRLFVKNKAADRKSQIEQSIPDMLDMLNMCVSQGLTILRSLRRISRDLEPVYPALAQELSIVCEQADVGTLQVALDNFSDRVDLPEVFSFTSLITQTERMGTSVSDALTEYSDNMRESLRQQADQKANQASFKLLFPTVLCLMPAVYIFLLGPAIIELSNFFEGGGNAVLETGADAILQLNR